MRCQPFPRTQVSGCVLLASKSVQQVLGRCRRHINTSSAAESSLLPHSSIRHLSFQPILQLSIQILDTDSRHLSYSSSSIFHHLSQHITRLWYCFRAYILCSLPVLSSLNRVLLPSTSLSSIHNPPYNKMPGLAQTPRLIHILEARKSRSTSAKTSGKNVLVLGTKRHVNPAILESFGNKFKDAFVKAKEKVRDNLLRVCQRRMLTADLVGRKKGRGRR